MLYLIVGIHMWGKKRQVDIAVGDSLFKRSRMEKLRDDGQEYFLGKKKLLDSGEKNSQWESAIGIISTGKEVEDSQTVDAFQIHLDRVLGHPVWTVLLPKKVGPDDVWGSIQPGILWV